MYQTIEYLKDNHLASIWLNRPKLHNAFNAQVIAELHHCLTSIAQDDSIRMVILGGRGKNFSAGADLNWMKQAGEASIEDNEQDALKLAQMLHTLATLNKPTLARVHGAALGGGMGLASACDICVASANAQFATSEVRLGLAASTISPYVIRAIGARQAGRYFLTAERINATRAYELGLVHEVCADNKALDDIIAQITKAILLGAPNAQYASKQLIAMVNYQAIDATLLTKTATHIAHLRAGNEAKGGLEAFLNKQSAPWVVA